MGSNATTSAQFTCTGCGVRYRWKEQWSGKKVRCKCGEVMVCPAHPEDEVYAVVPDAPLPVSAPNAQAASATVVAYRAPQTTDGTKNAAFADQTLDLNLPLCLIVGGLVIHG